MKRFFVLLLVCITAFSLSACISGAGDDTSDTTTQATAAAGKDPKDLAMACKDKPVSELVALIGEPLSTEYVPSCLNPGVGEDGFWEYDGFTVYTYRANDKETVYEVE